MMAFVLHDYLMEMAGVQPTDTRVITIRDESGKMLSPMTITARDGFTTLRGWSGWSLIMAADYVGRRLRWLRRPVYVGYAN
jgi:hypothetical protein